MERKKSLVDVEKGERRKKYYENEIRIKQREIKKLTRGERTHKFYSGYFRDHPTKTGAVI